MFIALSFVIAKFGNILYFHLEGKYLMDMYPFIYI